ncbi:uncharacterized protein [Epargyreus clarus]|uniref:uncharacterized protein n=1 Tax=Epargyreus clarus TaxID=520877 RepID=UPI003C2F6D42
MDYCDPYHCNDYHRIACGLNRRQMRFKWFQSVCHLILNNQCATYRGTLSYDLIETKFCTMYVMYLRTGCPTVCQDEMKPVCAISLQDNHVVVFRNKCSLDAANCRAETFQVCCVTELSTSTTLNVKKRVALLKKRLKHEIRSKQDKFLRKPFLKEDVSLFEDSYENPNAPITPIMYVSKKIKRKMTVTTSTVKTPAITKEVETSTPFSRTTKKEIMPRNMSDGVSILRKPVEIFYRRFSKDMMNTELQWAHCQDMITPYLNGDKKDFTKPKHLSSNSPVVIRLIQLLNVNTTSYTKEDIYSVLYQISNLQLRLFQWDVPALNLLFRMLVHDNHHTFRNLKRGIREQFAEWRLDISNITNLLNQARIYRPPCIRITDSTGSTKSHKITKYPKKTRPTTVCESDEDYECR